MMVQTLRNTDTARSVGYEPSMYRNGSGVVEPTTDPPGPGQGGSQAGATGGASRSPGGTVPPNPSIRIDPALGIAVIEVRDSTGKVTMSVPTERELEAYQRDAKRSQRTEKPASGTEARAEPAEAEPAGEAEPTGRPLPPSEPASRPGHQLDVDL